MNRSFPNVSLPHPPQTLEAEVDSSGDVIDLASLLNTLWRGKWLIAFIVVVFALLGSYYAYFLARPEYTANSVIILETNQEEVVDLGNIFPGLSNDDTAINSELEVMRSRLLIGRVVDQLNLTDNPEFNPTLQEPSLIDLAKQSLAAILRNEPESPEMSEAERAEYIRNLAINNVLDKINIRNVPDTLVFNVSATTHNRHTSVQLTETLVSTYIDDQLQVKLDQTNQATTWLSERVADLQTQLENAEIRAQEFSANTDLVSQEALLGAERQLKEVRTRIEDMTLTIANTEQLLAQEKSARTYEEKAGLFSDTQLNNFLAQIESQGIRQAFDTRYEQLVARAQAELLRARNQLATLQASEQTFENQIKQQNADLIQLQQLTREAEATRLLYEHFLTRLKETSAQQGTQKADSRQLSHAVVPTSPSAPRKSVLMAMSILLGFFAGAALVLIRELRQNTFRTAQDLERQSGYTVMGQIPLLPARVRKDLIQYLIKKPTSAGAEAIRNLRTSILLSNVDTPPQVIGTTSSLPGEGKTTLSLAMAQNFTGLGKKVLIIEGDIRRRVFKQYLKTDQKQGLISVLSGEARIKDAVISDDRLGSGADVLIGEKSAINAADLFSSEAFQRMISEARGLYDTIIIDTPPVLVVPDARIIAQHVDAMIFVVAWDSTSKTQVKDALHIFEASGQRVNGLVLNQINLKGMRKYGYGGEYGAYGAYGGNYYVN